MLDKCKYTKTMRRIEVKMTSQEDMIRNLKCSCTDHMGNSQKKSKILLLMLGITYIT